MNQITFVVMQFNSQGTLAYLDIAGAILLPPPAACLPPVPLLRACPTEQGVEGHDEPSSC